MTEVVTRDVRLDRLPVLTCWPEDGGPFVTLPLVYTEHPEGAGAAGRSNLGMYRLQVFDDRTLGMHWQLHKGGAEHFRAAASRGDRMPVAIALGPDPSLIYAATAPLPPEIDELMLAGFIRKRSVEMVRCVSIDMEVPAYAEIVIEGHVLPGVREDEGPFGEVTNYTAGQGQNPVFEVTAITTRRDPIYRHIQATRFTDHQVLGALPVEAGLFNRIRETAGGIDVHEVACPAWCSRYTVIVQLTPRFDGEARAALLSALSSPYLFPKVAVAVDADVDIHDARDVMWAMATRVNPETDVHVIPGMRAHGLDLASPELLPPGSPAWQRVGGKMLIDATKPATWRTAERGLFERARPRGWGIRLDDFLRG